MRKIIPPVIIALLILGTVTALDIDATRWSLRGDLDESNVGGQLKNIVQTAKGELNANLNLQRGFQTQGYVTLKGKTYWGEKFSLKLNWNSKGNEYDAGLIRDAEKRTRIIALARGIFHMQGSPPETYYDVPIIIVYNKEKGIARVETLGFRFKQIEVTNLLE